jgi:hypothetical protein
MWYDVVQLQLTDVLYSKCLAVNVLIVNGLIELLYGCYFLHNLHELWPADVVPDTFYRCLLSSYSYCMRLSCLCLKVTNLTGIMYVRFLTFDKSILKMYKIEICEGSDHVVDIVAVYSCKITDKEILHTVSNIYCSSEKCVSS